MSSDNAQALRVDEPIQALRKETPYLIDEWGDPRPDFIHHMPYGVSDLYIYRFLVGEMPFKEEKLFKTEETFPKEVIDYEFKL